MRCALAIPAWRPEDLFPPDTAGSQINYWEPLGTLYVAAALQQAGHEVRFFNGAFMSHAEILAGVRQFAPAFVGVYSTTFGWPRAIHLTRAVKALDPCVFVCAGGPYPIALQQRCLLGEGQDIDAVVTGEAEVTVTELVDRLETGRALDGVLGLAFRRGQEIVCTAPRPLVEDLDTLPFPARELLGDPHRYLPPPATYRRKPVAVVLTSRGCSRRCIFCFQIDRARRAGQRGVRYRSVDNVLEEIEQCLALGYREIKFIDDSFAADYDRAMTLSKAIRARRLDFVWFASACANQVDRPLLQSMKAAGCWAILLGAESGVQRHLNTLRKGTTLDQIRVAVHTAKDVGLQVSTPFLFGIPGETYQDGLRTIDFAIELDPDLANFHALTAFPGTPLHEHLNDYGTVSDDLSQYTYQRAAFAPYTLRREQVQELRQLAFRRFYSRPSYLLRRLARIQNWNDCRAAAIGVRSLFWLWVRKRLFTRPAAPLRGVNPPTAAGTPRTKRDRAAG